MRSANSCVANFRRLGISWRSCLFFKHHLISQPHLVLSVMYPYRIARPLLNPNSQKNQPFHLRQRISHLVEYPHFCQNELTVTDPTLRFSGNGECSDGNELLVDQSMVLIEAEPVAAPNPSNDYSDGKIVFKEVPHYIF